MTDDTPAPPPPRLSRKGNALLKPPGGPPALTKRHLAMIRFMVHGLDVPFPRWPDIAPHAPLDAATAGEVAGLRRKDARDLLNWPIFVTELNRQITALRKGELARSIHTMIEVRDDPGAGKAADRKVRLAACVALAGEGGSTTNINVNTGTQVFSAGLVIDLRDDEDTKTAPRIIEHAA